ncbi:MAG: MmgE/PrpD family protein [Desulfatirhabdiaceae bacterium]
MGVTRELAEYVSKAGFQDIPKSIIEQTKLCVLDWLGVALAGSREELAAILADLIKEVGGEKQATVIGKGFKTSVLNAALINGAMSHALDLDDYHAYSLTHPSVTILPAVLAVAEYKKLSGADVLTAAVMGYEVLSRASGGSSRTHYDRGWHATSTVGRYGAAAGVAKLLKLNPDKIINALGITGTQSGGVRQGFGTMCKPFHPGKAASDGVMSAFLAERGFTGSKEIVEGKYGFYDIFTANANEVESLKDLGKYYHVSTVSFKPYPSCGATHSTIDLMKELRGKADINIDDVAEIILEVNSIATDAAGQIEPKTALEGKFSVYYCAALALAEGDVGIEKFTDEKVNDPKLVELRRKVKASPTLKDLFGARVTIRMKDGKEYKAYAPVPKGDPGNPLSFDELAEKFKSVAGTVLPESNVNKLIEKVMVLEKITDAGEITALCNP